MKKYIISLLLLTVFIVQDLSAQRLGFKSREVGLNVSPLLSQVVPFNNSSRRTGPYSFLFRSGRNNKYFNFELGVQIFEFDNNTDRNHFNLAIGVLRKNPFGGKFMFFNSYNFVLSAGSFNEPNDPTDGDGVSLGFSYGPGIEYHINDYFYVATESHLFMGVFEDGFRIHVIPPVSFFLIIKLN